MAGGDWEKTFVETLERLAGRAAQERVLCGLGTLPDSAEGASWIREAVARLDRDLDPETRAAVLEPCGRACLGSEGAARARELGARFADLDPLLAVLNEKRVAGGGLRREGDTIYAVYDRCYCPRVSSAVAPISPTYCHCSRGWLGALFAALLGREVEVELISSILGGASSCLFALRPGGR